MNLRTRTEATFVIVVEKHITYAQKLGASLEILEHQQWIDTCGGTHVTVMMAADEAIKTIDVADANADPRTVLVIAQEVNLAQVKFNTD